MANVKCSDAILFPSFPAAVWIISASVAVVDSRNFRDSVAEIVSDG